MKTYQYTILEKDEMGEDIFSLELFQAESIEDADWAVSNHLTRHWHNDDVGGVEDMGYSFYLGCSEEPLIKKHEEKVKWIKSL